MKKVIQVIMVLGIIFCIIIIYRNIQVITHSETTNANTFDLSDILLVPETLTSMQTTDLNNNTYEIFSNEFSYKLLIFSNQGCEACALLLEDVYNNEKMFATNSIGVNFIWLGNKSEIQNISKYLEENKVPKNSGTIQHVSLTLDEYLEFGFSQGPIPLISIYNKNGELRFQSYGYSNQVVEQMNDVVHSEYPIIERYNP